MPSTDPASLFLQSIGRKFSFLRGWPGPMPPRARHAAPSVTEKARTLLEALFPQEKPLFPHHSEPNEIKRSQADDPAWRKAMHGGMCVAACPFLTCAALLRAGTLPPSPAAYEHRKELHACSRCRVRWTPARCVEHWILLF